MKINHGLPCIEKDMLFTILYAKYVIIYYYSVMIISIAIFEK